jgi:biopolymer transport protein ExbB
MELLHQISFGMMILAGVIALVVSIERIIFSSVNLVRSKQVLVSVNSGESHQLESHLKNDAVSHMVSEILKIKAQNFNPNVYQDRIEAAYLEAKDALGSRLWILDTVVTAAPLMGLLGTIFGIVDTFLALSKSGMSDPSSVSSGIGTALYATALGISIALLCLLIFNFLNDRNERIIENIKMFILRA